MTRIPPDFIAFLRSLNEHDVEYLVIGGYAVGYYGYVRATADFDIWIRPTAANSERAATALQDFGFELPEVTPDLFMNPNRIVRMGRAPVRLELQTTISGVQFDECWQDRERATLGGVETHIISLEKLKMNKRAAGRLKDLNDLKHLP